MIKKAIIGMILFSAIFYYTLIQYFGDVQINKYDSKVVVQQEQAIEHGWIPGIIPDSAFEIAETHDLDTNIIVGSFKYKEEDEAKFMEVLTTVPDMNQTYTWENFLFKVDKEKKRVKFRNKPAS
jgi:hypothetical protein